MGTISRLVLASAALLVAHGAKAQSLPDTPSQPEPPPVEPVTVAAPAPVVSPLATLNITTDVPGAVVSLDGGMVGLSPLKLEGVLPGVHQVRVEHQGQPAQTRSVTVSGGGVLEVHFPAAAAPAEATLPAVGLGGPSPGTPGVGKAMKDFAWDVLVDTPWVGFLVIPAVGVAVLAAILWTTNPSDLPFNEQVNYNIQDSQWRVLRFASLATALVFGGVSLVVLLLPSTPLGKLSNVVRAASEN
jgi:hypothetical protein